MNIHDQIKSVSREIKMRQRVYPRWVAEEKISQAEADWEIAAMKAALNTLIEIADKDQGKLNL